MPEDSRSTTNSPDISNKSDNSPQIFKKVGSSSTLYLNSLVKGETGEINFSVNSFSSNTQSDSGSSQNHSHRPDNLRLSPGIVSPYAVDIPKNALFRESVGYNNLPIHLSKSFHDILKTDDPSLNRFSNPELDLSNIQISSLSDDEQGNVAYLESGQSKNKTRKRVRKLLKIIRQQFFKLLGLLIVLFSIIILSVIAIFTHHHPYHRKGFPDLKSNPGRYKPFKNLRLDLVDNDTPMKFRSKIGSDGLNWTLAFSDEFNVENRTFYKGDDQFFTSMDYHYGVTNNMEYYSPDHVTTYEGALRMTLDETKSKGLNFTSGMVQSWNQLCINQGYIEVSVRLPGSYDSKGLWPAVWLLGNLGRAGYQASTDGVWPYSYDSCDVSVGANQSSDDGLSYLPGMRLSSCTCNKQEHPSPGRSRGAPEIDIMEGLHNKIAQSYNIAPFDIWRYPDYDHIMIPNQNITSMNSFMGSAFQEAISSVTTTNPNWFEHDYKNKNNSATLQSRREFITIGMEYMSDEEDNMKNYIKYYIGGELVFQINGGALHPDGNVGWRTIPKEPLSLILNLGISKSWSDVQLKTIKFPVNFDVDYIRVYQPPGKKLMTCDPELYPTVDYINQHWKAYANPNFTSWKLAGYKSPKTSLKNKCKPAKISI